MVTSLGKQIAPQVDGKLVVSGDFDPSSDLARFDVPEICPAAPRVGCDATWASSEKPCINGGIHT